MSTNKFQIGDEVRIVRLDVPTGRRDRHTGKIGHIGKIVEISPSGYCTLNPYCEGGSFLPECLEHVLTFEEEHENISNLFAEKLKQITNGNK